MDLDIALHANEPPKPTVRSSIEEKARYEKWGRANRLSLMIMKRSISHTLIGAISKTENAKRFFDDIVEKYKSSEKADAGELMDRLTGMKYDGVGGVREYIMKMVDITARLTELEIPITESFLVHHPLNSLPSQFDQLKTSYNTQKDKWNTNELISICDQEEKRILRGSGGSVNFVSQPNMKGHSSSHNYRRNNKGGNKIKNQKSNGPKPAIKKEINCWFCKKNGHKKFDCHKYKNWLAKNKSGGVQEQAKAK
ncbi:uncharacterized protein LOC127799580 [Diospyros lotus]|uniref:uncharacterized protein LOC127799580 n=1 Tax=Diospyros lotus TaxID=55363 RepID=UPI00225BCF21|nr:uncharacterized protein LOC127799580 [Diospyros lotus]